MKFSEALQTILIGLLGLVIGAMAVSAYLRVSAPPGSSHTTRLNFSFSTGNAETRNLAKGWWSPEAWGTWSIAKEAEIMLPPISPQPGNVSLEFALDLYVRPPTTPRQTLRLTLNGQEILLIEATKQTTGQVYAASVPDQIFNGNKPNILTFEIGSPTSPQEAGDSADPRKLGVALRSVAISYAPRVVYECATELMPSSCGGR